MTRRAGRNLSFSFGQLLRYINSLPTEQLGTQAIFHNLRTTTDDLKAIEREFLDDCRYVQYRRDGIFLFHEIISVGEADRMKTSEAMLVELTKHYLRLRAPDAKAYAKAQFDTDNPHVHIMIAANRIGSSKKLRMSKSEFGSAQRALEKYQREKYPDLTHSIVFDKQPAQIMRPEQEKLRKTPVEHERERRLTKEDRYTPTHKEQVRDRLVECLHSARSEAELVAHLKQANFEPYIRGRTAGVTDLSTGKNYRLKTLGLDFQAQEKMRRLRQIPEREAQMQAIEREMLQEQVQKLGFIEDIQDVLHAVSRSNQPETIQRREEQIREALRQQRQQDRDQTIELDQEVDL